MRYLDYALLIFTGCMVITGGLSAFLFGYILPKEIKEETESLRSRMVESGSDEPEDDGGSSIARYSWLTSVNLYRYKDLPNSLEFFCAGTIITKDKMMTGDSCLKEHFTLSDLKDAVIRSNSDYFWKNGQTHKVLEVIENVKLKKPYRNIYILKVSPNFDNSCKKLKLISAPSVSRTNTCDDGKLVIAGWGGDQDQTEQIRKKQRFAVHQWLPKKLVTCSDKLCHKVSPNTKICCNEAIMTNEPVMESGPVSGKVLVNVRSGPPQLLAIELIHLFKGQETKESDLTYFVDLGDPDFISWVRTEAPEAVLPPNEPLSSTNTKYRLYSQMETSKYISDMQYFSRFNPLTKYPRE